MLRHCTPRRGGEEALFGAASEGLVEIEIYVVERREVFNFGEFFVKRFPRSHELQHGWGFYRLHD